MELSELKIGDKVEIKAATQKGISGSKWEDDWYNAEVVDKFYDELGDYVKVLIFPTSIWGEYPMTVRNGENLRLR